MKKNYLMIKKLVSVRIIQFFLDGLMLNILVDHFILSTKRHKNIFFIFAYLEMF